MGSVAAERPCIRYGNALTAATIRSSILRILSRQDTGLRMIDATTLTRPSVRRRQGMENALGMYCLMSSRLWLSETMLVLSVSS